MRSSRSRSTRALPLVVVALIATPTLLGAQWRRGRERERTRERYVQSDVVDRDLTFLVGALRSDADDRSFPMATMRVNWRLRRWLRSELGASYAIGDRPVFATSGVRTADSRVQLATATAGLQAQLPLEYVRPYVGIAAGLFGRHEERGERFVRTTMAFPAGIRLMISPRLAVQGEARFRFDQQRNGGQTPNVERTGGISVAF